MPAVALAALLSAELSIHFGMGAGAIHTPGQDFHLQSPRPSNRTAPPSLWSCRSSTGRLRRVDAGVRLDGQLVRAGSGVGASSTRRQTRTIRRRSRSRFTWPAYGSSS